MKTSIKYFLLVVAAGIVPCLFAQEAPSAFAYRLVGHWRESVSEQPSIGSVELGVYSSGARDTHLVLLPNGTGAMWTVREESRNRTRVTKGYWRCDSKTLLLVSDAGEQYMLGPYTFHNGQLVFPNTQNQRRYWDRIQ